VEYVTFGWDSGPGNTPADLIDSDASLVKDGRGNIIYGKLIAVLHDGTLLFQDTYDNMWSIYREGEKRAKRFNPGNIRFQREYVDQATGEYTMAFTALYYGDPDLNNDDWSDEINLRSDNYSMATAEFLELVGY
jgi:hypothetical protein